jgi:hypothetical protein
MTSRRIFGLQFDEIAKEFKSLRAATANFSRSGLQICGVNRSGSDVERESSF